MKRLIRNNNNLVELLVPRKVFPLKRNFYLHSPPILEYVGAVCGRQEDYKAYLL